MASALLKKRNKVQVVILFMGTTIYELLLLRTNKERGSFWQNVTGGVEKKDHDIMAAAAREVKEEVGLEAKELIDLKQQTTFQDRWKTNVTEHLFLAIFSQKQKVGITIDPNEHQEFKLIPINMVAKKNYQFLSNYDGFTESMNYLKRQGVSIK